MFDNLLKKIETMLGKYIHHIENLQKALEESNYVVSELNKTIERLNKKQCTCKK